MPVDVTCTSCQKRMRVPDTAAGKRIKCPQCQAAIYVPGPVATAVPVGMPVELWHLKTEDGQTYGPIPRADLDVWNSEGRLTANCQVLRQGSDQWQWATDLYPQLDPAYAAQAVAAPVAVGQPVAVAPNPFDFSSPAPQAAPSPENPFDFSTTTKSSSKSYAGSKYKGRRGKGSGVVTAVAIVNYVIGCLQLVAGVLVIVFGGAAAAAITGAASGDKEMRNAGLAMGGIIGTIIIVMGVIMIVFSLPSLAAGYGVMERKQWGRILTLVLGGLHGAMAVMSILTLNPGGLLNLGYAIFVFVVLLNKQHAAEFR